MIAADDYAAIAAAATAAAAAQQQALQQQPQSGLTHSSGGSQGGGGGSSSQEQPRSGPSDVKAPRQPRTASPLDLVRVCSAAFISFGYSHRMPLGTPLLSCVSLGSCSGIWDGTAGFAIS